MGVRIWLLNLALAASAVLLGMKAHTMWTEQKGPAIEAPAVDGTEAFPKKDFEVKRPPRQGSYASVAESNLFHVSRAEVENPSPAPKAAGPHLVDVPKTPPKVYLNGVVLTETDQMGLVRNLKASPGEKRERWVRVGDRVDDFEVTAIERDRIVLRYGSEEVPILLHDKDKPRAKVARAGGKGPTVIAMGSKPSATPKPKKAVARTTPATTVVAAEETPKRTPPPIFGGSSKRKEQGKETAAGDTPGAERAQPANPFQELLEKIRSKNETGAEGENPFGAILQKKGE